MSFFAARADTLGTCSPRSLGLPSADEITAMEHLDLLRLNGYEVVVDEDAQIGDRVKLVAQPVSKDTVFDVGGEAGRCFRSDAR